MPQRPWTQTADGVVLDVRLTPRSACDAAMLAALLERLIKESAKVTT
jgi:hypothetical protein